MRRTDRGIKEPDIFGSDEGGVEEEIWVGGRAFLWGAEEDVGERNVDEDVDGQECE